MKRKHAGDEIETLRDQPSHFDAFAISHETGCTKPASEIFQRAAAELDVPPGRILHVGDSATEDVSGARAAGISATLLDRKAGRNGSATVSDLRWLATAGGKHFSGSHSD